VTPYSNLTSRAAKAVLSVMDVARVVRRTGLGYQIDWVEEVGTIFFLDTNHYPDIG
jgi:hypothetical protein